MVGGSAFTSFHAGMTSDRVGLLDESLMPIPGQVVLACPYRSNSTPPFAKFCLR